MNVEVAEERERHMGSAEEREVGKDLDRRLLELRTNTISSCPNQLHLSRELTLRTLSLQASPTRPTPPPCNP